MYAQDDYVEPRVFFERTAADVPAPHRAHIGDAGADLTFHSLAGNNGNRIHPEAVTIAPGETVKIGTGIAVAIPIGYVGLLAVRSSIGTKKLLRLANSTGYIDAGYRGEIMATLQNTSRNAQTIRRGDRILQLVIVPALIEPWSEHTLDETERGTGGFGSTGA